ncbi:MAG: shikimate dehydrogenase [Bacteroidetes bacterium GWF2_42_66]|nr:MAG: shikimate dehydrogenase [Bacteroidetes bacterium GWA2_42_15]OFY02636.1 MAG: shikimate dehydrogenase [Bacteroidetes bacterium GWE2_42_39]OFY41472.1 MAG: shikimate dehydrogenase [Bacteroidetes bacterium GWF2_42_66]HBL75408.1 shikimate dehydrogenase [Prolixibacteraceae bacterium]HCR90979.1 shikimate dehydrogenase [Prolixibacteraceae bacterium]
MKTFGLIGHRLGYSFSKKFFSEKFEKENLKEHEYVNFELDSIDEFPGIFKKNPNLAGLNCTIPYKQQIMKYLDEINPEAAEVGAVNTVKIIRKDGAMKLIGYNSDVYGFENSLKPMLSEKHKKALILGTGGASKAIKYILTKLGIEYISASIEEQLFEKEIRYSDIDEQLIKERLIIINATPLGTFPNVDNCADIPYQFISSDHVLFDLVYNPEETLFMKKGKERGAAVKNGLEMLHLQAIRSWEIWNM